MTIEARKMDLFGTETKEIEEVKESVMTTEPSIYDELITEDIDFRVETRGLHTTDKDGGLHMPNHEATIRINPDGTEAPLWVVGSRYEVVDHRNVIKGFAEALDKASLPATVDHKVYASGCRIFSYFILDKKYDIGSKSGKAQPFFTLTTSHDGSLKIGFMVGAKVGDRVLNVSKTVYGAWAKHTKGVNVESTLKEISKALDAFVSEVLPMWERMQGTSVCVDDARKILDDAVSAKVIAKRRADTIEVGTCETVWDVYTSVVSEVCNLTTKRSTEERAFDRNTNVGEYFRKLAASGRMEAIVKE
jgi:hypothetical protein